MQHLSKSHQDLINNAVLQVATAVEESIDKELEEDLETLRARRIKELQEKAANREKWLRAGHGEYIQIEEKNFFDEAKKSQRLIVHFFRDSNMACKVVDHHLSQLAQKHLETRFLKIDAEKSPFLTERLKIWMLPTLVLVKDGQT